MMCPTAHCWQKDHAGSSAKQLFHARQEWLVQIEESPQDIPRKAIEIAIYPSPQARALAITTV